MGNRASCHPVGRHPKSDVSRAVSGLYRRLYQGVYRDTPPAGARLTLA
jgi:hypothetical protein